jgi:uncharacterized protein YkwD
MKLLLLTLALSLPALAFANGLPVTSDPVADAPRESALLRETNVARASYGLSPLARDEGLARAARSHAAEMAALGYFSHGSPNPENATLSQRLARAGVPSVTAGENLALLRGPQELAPAAVRGWLESPAHRAALLHREYTHVGFGVAYGADGEAYIAQVFARRPRRLLAADVSTQARGGFELNVWLDVPRRLTVVPRLAGSTGESLTLEPGRRELVLHTASGAQQQLVLASALDDAGHYVIQDGGWVTPREGSWRADETMPRSALAIANVTVGPARGQVIRLALEYEPSGAPLAVFVNGSHYREAEVAPGSLLLYLPAGEQSSVQVGEANGSLVTPFDSFVVATGSGGPRLFAGKSPW